MSLPVITHTRPRISDEPVSITAASRLAGMSRHSVEAVLGGGYVSLVRSDITALSREPYITAEGALPVLQTGPAEKDGSWRPYTGDALWLSDEDWLLAQCGDWTGVDSEAVIRGGYLAVGLGGMITGIARVLGSAAGAPEGRVRWNLGLVGRLVGTLRDGQLSFGQDAGPEERAFVKETVGMRHAVHRSGTFTWI